MLQKLRCEACVSRPLIAEASGSRYTYSCTPVCDREQVGTNLSLTWKEPLLLALHHEGWKTDQYLTHWRFAHFNAPFSTDRFQRSSRVATFVSR